MYLTPKTFSRIEGGPYAGPVGGIVQLVELFFRQVPENEIVSVLSTLDLGRLLDCMNRT